MDNPYRIITAAVGFKKELDLTNFLGCNPAYTNKLLNATMQNFNTNVIDKILVFEPKLYELINMNKQEIIDSYYEHQSYKRKLNYGKLKIDPTFYYKINPWLVWLSQSHINRNEVGRLYCIDQAILQPFETDIKKHILLPNPIYNALIDAGYSLDLLTEFNLVYTNYRQYALQDAAEKNKTLIEARLKESKEDSNEN